MGQMQQPAGTALWLQSADLEHFFKGHRLLTGHRLDFDLDSLCRNLLQCTEVLIINRENIDQLAFARNEMHAADIKPRTIESKLERPENILRGRKKEELHVHRPR